MPHVVCSVKDVVWYVGNPRRLFTGLSVRSFSQSVLRFSTMYIKEAVK